MMKAEAPYSSDLNDFESIPSFSHNAVAGTSADLRKTPRTSTNLRWPANIAKEKNLHKEVVDSEIKKYFFQTRQLQQLDDRKGCVINEKYVPMKLEHKCYDKKEKLF